MSNEESANESHQAAVNDSLYCPGCGQNGGFDGMGYEKREFTISSMREGEKMVIETLYRFHCPECDDEFLTVEGIDER